MLAERLKGMHLTIKEKTHDDGKLYGAFAFICVALHLRSENPHIIQDLQYLLQNHIGYGAQVQGYAVLFQLDLPTL